MVGNPKSSNFILNLMKYEVEDVTVNGKNG